MEEKERIDQAVEQQNEEENKEKVVVPVKEEKEKRSKKRWLLLLLLLIITGIMLTTSTYAWFTSNRTVTVEDIDVNVAASGGIQISVDGTSWKSIITNQDLANAHATYTAATNQIPSTLKPVSTAAKVLDTNGYLSMWLGTVSTSETSTNRGKYILSTEDVSTVADNSASADGTGSNGYFVSFDLFIRLDENTEASLPLYLTDGSNVTFKSGGSDLGTQNASRVAFINEGNVATGSDLAKIQGLKTTETSNIYVWEPNYEAHTSTGLANAYSYYNTVNQGNAYTAANAGNQVPYFGTIDAVTVDEDITLDKANATDNSTKFAAITPGIATKSNWAETETQYKQLFNLTANAITKMKVYFWVEGQDIDCENNASGGKITLKLQFSLNEGESVSP